MFLDVFFSSASLECTLNISGIGLVLSDAISRCIADVRFFVIGLPMTIRGNHSPIGNYNLSGFASARSVCRYSASASENVALCCSADSSNL